MKKQGYKDRQDESYGMKKSMGVMKHDSKPMKCDAFAAQKQDMGRVQKRPEMSRGYPKQAMDYSY